jgi:hypothetical protein
VPSGGFRRVVKADGETVDSIRMIIGKGRCWERYSGCNRSENGVSGSGKGRTLELIQVRRRSLRELAINSA